MFNLRSIVDEVKKEVKLYLCEKNMFPFTIKTGLDSKIMIVAGDNATGKSLFTRLFGEFAKKKYNIKTITISLNERVNGNTNARRIINVEDEKEQSTGALSVKSIKKGFLTLSKWSVDDKTLLIIDEPELGLAEGYRYALGQYIRQQVDSISSNENFIGLIVATHSKSLSLGLTEGKDEPNFIYMGNENKDFNSWINSKEKKSVDELLNLIKVCDQRHEQVAKMSLKLKKSA